MREQEYIDKTRLLFVTRREKTEKREDERERENKKTQREGPKENHPVD